MSEKAIIRVARQIEASTKVPSGEASKKRDPAPAKRSGDESKAERQTAEQASSDDDDDDSPSEMSLIIARLMDGQQKMADEMAALRLLLTSIKQEPQQQQQQPPPQQQQDGSAVQPTFIPQQPKGAAPLLLRLFFLFWLTWEHLGVCNHRQSIPASAPLRPPSRPSRG